MTRKNTKPARHDPQILATCTCANLRKATRVVTQIYDAALQSTGLRTTQFTLLATLSRLEHAPLSRLADALVMDRTTLTRNLKPLVDKGLIRSDQEKDQRVRMISLTTEGKKTFENAVPQWRKAQTQMIDGLGPEHWSNLLDGLASTLSLAQGR